MRILFVICFSLIFQIVNAEGIKPEDVSQKPTEFCQVLKEPNPLLMGGWKCRVKGQDSRGFYDNPVQYWLVKYEDKLAVYYYFTRFSGTDVHAGWRNWIVDGDKISSPEGNIKFLVKDGNIFFSFKDKDPIQMTKIE
jgi:hypothetical protein